MPSLSHSQVADLWDKCPYRWKLQKIDRVAQAPAAPLIFGDAIHGALEADGLRYIDGTKRLTFDEINFIFRNALRDRMAADDPDGKWLTMEQVAGMYDDGALILQAYVDRIQPYYKPQAVEEEFGKERTIDIPGAPGWTFTGRLDARIRLASGWSLLDFKTGKPWPKGEEHSRPQAAAYLWAESQLRAHPAALMTFLFLPVVDRPDGTRVCLPELRTTTRSESNRYAYQEHLREVALQINEAKASGVYLAKTSLSCQYCPVSGACEPGRAFMAKKKLSPLVPVIESGGPDAEAQAS
jgi:hypothetical protein